MYGPCGKTKPVTIRNELCVRVCFHVLKLQLITGNCIHFCFMQGSTTSIAGQVWEPWAVCYIILYYINYTILYYMIQVTDPKYFKSVFLLTVY